jgi:hypothetical protein
MTQYAIEAQHGEPAIAAISERFREFCGASDLTMFSAGADKHGSVVWEAGKVVGGLNRYVTFSLTPDASLADWSGEPILYFTNWGPGPHRFIAGGQAIISSGEPFSFGETKPNFELEPGNQVRMPNRWSPYRASVSVLVDNDTSYTSHVLESWKYESEEDIFKDIQNGHLERAWRNGWAWVNELTERNLTEAYGQSRPQSA